MTEQTPIMNRLGKFESQRKKMTKKRTSATLRYKSSFWKQKYDAPYILSVQQPVDQFKMEIIEQNADHRLQERN